MQKHALTREGWLGGVKRWLAGACFALLAFAAPHTSAQERRDRDPSFEAARQISADLLRANFHWGPFYLLSRFQLADIGFDQALFFPTEEQVGGFGVGVSAPQRLYFVPRKKLVFSVDAVPSYHWFSSGDQNNQFGYRVRGDTHFLLNHLHLDFYIARADELRSGTVEVNRLVTQRNSETGLNGEFRYSSKTSLTFGTRYSEGNHPRSRLQPLDRDVSRLDRSEEQVWSGLRHRTFPRTSTLLRAELIRYDFTVADENDSRRTHVRGGFLYDARGNVLRLEAGPGVLDFRAPGRKDFRGVLGSGNVSRRAGLRWDFGALAVRDLDFSITPENGYYVTDRGALSGQYAATRRLSLRAGISSGRDTYPVPVAGIKRQDTFAFPSVGWSYTTRRIIGGFDVGYFDRNSNVNLDEQSGIRVLIHLSFSP